MKTIKINTNYLNVLPTNCIFNKKVTGCGGTSVAIFGEYVDCSYGYKVWKSKPYIIAVPTTELITNKIGTTQAGVGSAMIETNDGKKHLKEVFGLFGTNPWKRDLKNYLNSYTITQDHNTIICTYDKLEALTEWLEKYWHTNFNLLIDEYQVLLKAYSYRDKAINGVLKSFRKYKTFCFMSATPISSEFMPESLKDIEVVEAEWAETDTLKVVLDQTNQPYQKVANMINSFKDSGFKMCLNGANVAEELFIFLNSVTDIANIIKYCNLSNNEVKIVCSDTEPNRNKLNGYTISNSRAENKPVTFITSKSFEGADYFSKNGISIVVSNSSKQCTQLDISTDIYQIAGRIRNVDNPYRKMLIHIFNTSGRNRLNLDISYDEKVDLVNKRINGAKKLIDVANNDEDASMAAIFNDEYIYKDENNKYHLNDMLIKLELFNFRINHEIYKNGISLSKTYSSNECEIFETEPDMELENNITKATTKITFKEAFLKYAEIKGNKFDMTDTSYLEHAQPLIVKAYSELGEKKVRELKYIKKNVEAAILNLDDTKNTNNKVAKLLKDEICVGFISCRDLKNIFSRLYDRLGITDTPKATIIEKYYECKQRNKRVEGVAVKGYEIYRSKIIFSEN